MTAGVVQMFRDAAEPQGRDRYSCSLPVWEFLRELGHTFGWQPQGTTYASTVDRDPQASARHNYQPGDALDPKRIEAQDALVWARALDAAKHSPHFAGITDAGSGTAARSGVESGASLRSQVDEFIQYAYGGAFTFVISVARDAGERASL